MKLLLLCLMAVVPLVASQGVPIPWTNCGAPTDHVKISQATASTWPPVPGQAVTITLAGAMDEQLNGGSYLLNVEFDGFPIVNQQGALSDLANVTWPIPAGPISIQKTITVPSVIPAGSTITVNSSALDSTGQELLCVSLTISIPSAAAEATEVDAEQLPLFPELPEESLLDLPAESFESRLIDLVESAASKVSLADVARELEKLVEGGVQMLMETMPEEQLQDEIPVPYTDCGQSGDEISIVNITSTEWPPVPGTPANLTVNFVANTVIQDGTYSAVVSVDGFPLVTKTGDISKYFKLPIQAGPVSMFKQVKLPDIPISGSVGIKLSGTDVNGPELFCLNLAFNL